MKKYRQLLSRSFMLALLLIIASCDSTITPHSEVGETFGDLSPMAGTTHTSAAVIDYDIIDLGTLGGNTSLASDINDHGQIVGISKNNSDHNLAFIWDDINGP